MQELRLEMLSRYIIAIFDRNSKIKGLKAIKYIKKTWKNLDTDVQDNTHVYILSQCYAKWCINLHCKMLHKRKNLNILFLWEPVYCTY